MQFVHHTSYAKFKLDEHITSLEWSNADFLYRNFFDTHFSTYIKKRHVHLRSFLDWYNNVRQCTHVPSWLLYKRIILTSSSAIWLQKFWSRDCKHFEVRYKLICTELQTLKVCSYTSISKISLLSNFNKTEIIKTSKDNLGI